MPKSKGSGPQRRAQEQQPQNRQRLAIAGVVGAVVLAALVGLVVWLGGRGGGVSLEDAAAAAGCTLKTYPDQGQQHVDSYDARVKYNSTPPTSGTHHQVPVIWGAYTQPVITVQEVHNLEHGGVIIHYGSEVDTATRDQLQAFYDDSPNGMLLAPMPRLGNKVTLSAWTKLATCERFDEDTFAAFRGAYRGNGPERFRIGDLQPGT